MGQSDSDTCIHILRNQNQLSLPQTEVLSWGSALEDDIDYKWHSVAWQLCSEQPQADLGQAVANAWCHARTRPVEKTEDPARLQT